MYAAEAMDDSAFGLHLARQIDPRAMWEISVFSMQVRQLVISGEALTLFCWRYCRISERRPFRLTQRSADTAIEIEFVGLPRYAARHNMEFGLALGQWRALLKERGAFHGQAAATGLGRNLRPKPFGWLR